MIKFSFLNDWRYLLAVTLVVGVTTSAAASPHPLLQLSLEELFEVTVTSVNKTPQAYAEVPAAIFVISAEDIRRSTATSLPELLRLAPGVDARQIDASHWAVSIRGFNGEFADKLLVLVDGVSVFSSIFSGVNWDELDMALGDIERIEVVRGPGAVTWGVNAVNGVINIITRVASAEDGQRLSVAWGDNLRPLASLSHSGVLGDDLNYRVSGFFRRNGNSDGITDRGNAAADDDWLNRRLEFRGDMSLSGGDQLSIILKGWNGQRRQVSDVVAPAAPMRSQSRGGAEFRGGTGLVSLRQQRSNGSQRWQIYFDARSRDELRFDSLDKTLDLDFNQHLTLSNGGERVWGVGYRRLHNRTDGTFTFSITPDKSTEDLFTAFIQRSWRFFDQRLQLTLGSKFERSSRVGFHAQPSVRVAWQLNPQSMVWGAVSRAVSTPSLAETNGTLMFSAGTQGGLPVFAALLGNGRVDAETMVAYELGWRRRFDEFVSLDVTAFVHDYDDLFGAPPSAAPVLDPLPVPHIVLPFMFDNFERGRLYGLEVAANWNVTKRWRLSGSYSFSRLTGISGFAQVISQAPPEQTFSLSSHSDIGERWELDGNLRYNDSQTAVRVDSWWSLDLRLGWRPTQQLNLSLIARELLDPEHFEYNDAVSAETASIGRSLFLRADWQY